MDDGTVPLYLCVVLPTRLSLSIDVTPVFWPIFNILYQSLSLSHRGC